MHIVGRPPRDDHFLQRADGDEASRPSQPATKPDRQSQDRGFILVALGTFLPLILAGAVLLAATSAFTERLESDRRLCRRLLAQGLERAGVHMKDLVDLNPEALKLRLEEQSAESGLALATARLDPISAAAFRAWIKKIRAQKLILDRRQRAHLRLANTELKRTQTSALRALNRSGDSFQQRSARTPHPVTAALTPDRPGRAPLWHPVPLFEREQTLKQAWLHQFELKGPSAKFMATKGRREDSCSVTLVPEGSRWRARIAEDKSWSKRW